MPVIDHQERNFLLLLNPNSSNAFFIMLRHEGVIMMHYTTASRTSAMLHSCRWELDGATTQTGYGLVKHPQESVAVNGRF